MRHETWIAVAAGLLAACGSPQAPGERSTASSPSAHGGTACATSPAPTPLPGVRPEHQTAAYWIALAPNPDAVLMTADQIDSHNRAFAAQDRAHPQETPLAPFDLRRPVPGLPDELRVRLSYLRERVADGRYVDDQGRPVDPEAFALPPSTPVEPGELRIALETIPVRCGPRLDGLYKPPVDLTFDRNQCSNLRPQEPVRVLGPWPNNPGLWLVRTRYALGFIDRRAALSPPVSQLPSLARTVHLRRPLRVGPLQLPVHTSLPTEEDRATVFTAAGPQRIVVPKTGVTAPRPLTRRGLLDEAFRFLGEAYGWGGQDGGRDCSRFLLDLFATFGLHRPRHSHQQSRHGQFGVAIPDGLSATDRMAALDAAHRRGIVLGHFPGHIFLYLGRDRTGTPMALHAFAEYLERCPEGGERARRVETIALSDLRLGANTSRRSFLERLTHLSVWGPAPGPELAAAARFRPAAPATEAPSSCASEPSVAALTTPRRPHADGPPARLLVSAPHSLSPLRLEIHDPRGQLVHASNRAPHRHGGPPYGYWAELPTSLSVGRYTVRLVDGSRTAVCQPYEVFSKGDPQQAAGSSVWRPRNDWDRGYEGLYALFVEKLFDHPLDDRTWPNLTELLADPAHNLLFDYLGQGEDSQPLSLKPDCADLPYFVRGYFSWKMRLPFAFRRCNRGIQGKAPFCDRDLESPLEGEEVRTEAQAFHQFARRRIADTVHSGSGRTGPDDERTDYYPVGLDRRSIHPGTIFADPYGHLFIVAKWLPQPLGGFGQLIGADAQPDGTIGRRRFWPGSFLFDPDTTRAGAGFKAFRPLRYRGGRLRPVANAEIASTGLAAFSRDQYRGTAQDFYNRLETLINPRPLDPREKLTVLVEALYEQVKRRVVSVENAVAHHRQHPGVIEMPRGYRIFETTGPWEDFSTPSRDMRLLIAFDTVDGFIDRVEQFPAQYGVAPGELTTTLARLRQALTAMLEERSFAYTNSVGATVSVTLADLKARLGELEMAYNPNDCVEVRWGAPPGSAAYQSCQRHAPGAQRDRMRRYRPWFRERKRPPR
ncbi:MAG: NlpC/P60 family protein [Myxococcota bacterium]